MIVTTLSRIITMRYQSIKFLIIYFILLTLLIIPTFIIVLNNLDLRSLRKKTSPIILDSSNISNSQKFWTYACFQHERCRRIFSTTRRHTLQTCQMICAGPMLWPMPKYISDEKKTISMFNLGYVFVKYNCEGKEEILIKEAYKTFYNNVYGMMEKENKFNGDLRNIKIKIKIQSCGLTKLRLDTREGYELNLRRYGRQLKIEISADNFFGARHGLETLSQLIWWDKYYETLQILHDIEIKDEPSFSYRGLMVDTSRNYFSLFGLKRILLGMAFNKLNVFHWHLTDAESFPFYSENFRLLSQYGSYGKEKLYTKENITEIINFAQTLGIRVLIEVDGPAHMFSGWIHLNSTKKLILHSSMKNSGQINPKNDDVYQILKLIYKDIFKLTQDDELFHLGGDEIEFDPWRRDVKKSYNFRNAYQNYDYKSIERIWDEVTRKMYGVLKLIKVPKYIILWSNKFLDSELFLGIFDPKSTIIQIWLGNSALVKQHMYNVIFSNVDAWYLDCGFGAWSSKDIKFCKYNSWETFYFHAPWTDMRIEQVKGGEACLWSEEVNENVLDTRIWPRTAAFAEAVWNPPIIKKTGVLSSKVSERLDFQRNRMLQRGIRSELVWSEFCSLNPEKC